MTEINKLLFYSEVEERSISNYMSERIVTIIFVLTFILILISNLLSAINAFHLGSDSSSDESFKPVSCLIVR